MNKFISKKEIKEHCDGCNNLEIKTAFTSGNKYYYYNNYMLPCFNCITACKQKQNDDEQKAYEDMEKAIDNMEIGISQCENMFEPDSLDDCYQSY